MKKLFYFLSSVLLGAIVATAGEPSAGKDKVVAPVEQLFRANEIQIGVFGAGAFGKVDYHDRIGTSTQKETVTKEHVVTTTVNLPNTEGGTATVNTKVTEKTDITKTSKFKYRQTSHQGYGGGIETNYFFTRYFGVGIEGEWLSAETAISAFGVSFIARYPIERGTWAFAPYGFIGGGAQFDSQNAAFGYFGAGAEIRFSPKWGIFADGRWTIHDEDLNYALVRVGVRYVF